MLSPGGKFILEDSMSEGSDGGCGKIFRVSDLKDTMYRAMDVSGFFSKDRYMMGEFKEHNGTPLPEIHSTQYDHGLQILDTKEDVLTEVDNNVSSIRGTFLGDGSIFSVFLLMITGLCIF